MGSWQRAAACETAAEPRWQLAGETLNETLNETRGATLAIGRTSGDALTDEARDERPGGQRAAARAHTLCEAEGRREVHVERSRQVGTPAARANTQPNSHRCQRHGQRDRRTEAGILVVLEFSF